MTDPYRDQHEITIAYDALKDTANVLQAHYITLSREAIGHPEQQRSWNERMRQVRNAVTAVDPNDREAIVVLMEECQRKLSELESAE